MAVTKGGITLPVNLDSKNINADVKKLANQFKAVTQQIDVQQKKVDELKAKLAGLQSGNITAKTSEIKKMQAEFDKTSATIDKTKAEIASLYQQLDELQANAFKAPGTGEVVFTGTEQAQFDAINAKLDQLEPKLESDKQKAAGLGAKLREATGTATQAEIDKTNQKLAESQTKLEGLKIKSEQTGEKLKNSLKKVSEGSSEIASGFEKLGNRLVGLGKRVFFFSVITMGLRGVREAIGNVIASDTEFQKSLNALKAALWTAFAPIADIIVPALKTLIGWVTSAIVAIGKFISMLTGKSYNAMVEEGKLLQKRSSAYGESTKQTKKNTKATKDNAKAAEKQLAAFDELNVLQEKKDTSTDTSDGGTTTVGTLGDSDFNQLTQDLTKMNGAAEILLSSIVAIAGAMLGWKIADTVLNFFAGVKKGDYDLSKKIGGALIGAGVALAIDNIKAILDGKYDAASLMGIIKSVISGVLVGAGLMTLGVGGVWIIPVAVVISLLISDLAANKEMLKQWFEGLKKTIKGLFTGDGETFFSGLDDLFESYFNQQGLSGKISKWLIDAIFGQGTYDKLKKESEKRPMEKLYEKEYSKYGENAAIKFISDMFKMMGDEIVKKYQELKEKGQEIGEKIKEGIESKKDDMLKVFETLKQDISDKFADTKAKFKEYFDNGVQGIKDAFSGVKQWFSDRWDEIKNIFSSSDDGVGAKFKSWFDDGYQKIEDAFSGIKQWAKDRIGDITSIFGDSEEGAKAKFGGWFSDAFDAVKEKLSGWGEFFKGLWDNVKEKFTNFGDKMGAAVGDSLKTAINEALKNIEKVINKAIGYINGALDYINQIPGVNIGHIKTITLPRLAQGAVIPPNRKFMAILGDQKQGTNIEAPLDTIKQAVREVLESGNYSTSGNQTFILELDGREVGRTFGQAIERENNRRGNNLIKTKLVFG